MIEINGNIRLYNADCMEIMQQYPDGYFDLAVVDPPYGINATNMSMGTHKTRSRNGGSGPGISTVQRLKGRLNTGSGKLKDRILKYSKFDWDNSTPDEAYFNELFRVSKNQIIWGGNYFDLPPTRGIVCWDKMQPWENFSQWEMAWTSFDKPAAIFRYSNTGGANKEKKIHPTQKPIELYYWLYHKYAFEDCRILDTHGGSLRSAIAAHRFGVKEFVGIEINKAYFDESVKGVKRHTSQIAMAL